MQQLNFIRAREKKGKMSISREREKSVLNNVESTFGMLTKSVYLPAISSQQNYAINLVSEPGNVVAMRSISRNVEVFLFCR